MSLQKTDVRINRKLLDYFRKGITDESMMREDLSKIKLEKKLEKIGIGWDDHNYLKIMK